MLVNKTPPEPTVRKASFSGKIKMAAIKPVIDVFFLINRYHLRTKHRRVTYNIFFSTIFLRVALFF